MRKQFLNHFELVEFEYADEDCDFVENRSDYSKLYETEEDKNKIKEQDEHSESDEEDQKE